MKASDIQQEIDRMTENRMTRIEFLAHKATQAVENRPGSGICVASDFNKEFARLIVEECAKKAEDVFIQGCPKQIYDPRLDLEHYYDIGAFTAFKAVERTFEINNDRP